MKNLSVFHLKLMLFIIGSLGKPSKAKYIITVKLSIRKMEILNQEAVEYPSKKSSYSKIQVYAIDFRESTRHCVSDLGCMVQKADIAGCWLLLFS